MRFSQRSSVIYFRSMAKEKHAFYNITRPGEYIAFINIKVSTMEGPGYVFLACDAFSEFAFHIGVEPNEDPDTVLKCVYLLMENKDFTRHIHKGFTLVFDRYEELLEKIGSIINHSNGKAIFNKAFHGRIASPVLRELDQFVSGRR